jgi:hypothetical protein
VPFIGERFIREIPASDNVCDIPSCVVGEMSMTPDTNYEAAFLIDLLDSNGEVGWDRRGGWEMGEETREMFGKCILSAI